MARDYPGGSAARVRIVGNGACAAFHPETIKRMTTGNGSKEARRCFSYIDRLTAGERARVEFAAFGPWANQQ
jgi:hypothetical protein